MIQPSIRKQQEIVYAPLIEIFRMTWPKSTSIDMMLIIILFLSAGIINQDAIAQQATTTELRFDDYRVARDKARAWLDQLEVDSVDLLRNNIKGKKKLAEILSVYATLLRHTQDPTDTERM